MRNGVRGPLNINVWVERRVVPLTGTSQGLSREGVGLHIVAVGNGVPHRSPAELVRLGERFRQDSLQIRPTQFALASSESNHGEVILRDSDRVASLVDAAKHIHGQTEAPRLRSKSPLFPGQLSNSMGNQGPLTRVAGEFGPCTPHPKCSPGARGPNLRDSEGASPPIEGDCKPHIFVGGPKDEVQLVGAKCVALCDIT